MIGQLLESSGKHHISLHTCGIDQQELPVLMTIVSLDRRTLPYLDPINKWSSCASQFKLNKTKFYHTSELLLPYINFYKNFIIIVHSEKFVNYFFILILVQNILIWYN